MAWHPNDLATDLDLLAQEEKILSSFNHTNWDEKRRLALNYHVVPTLKANGFDITRFRTRYEPDAVVSLTGPSTYTDRKGAATSTATDDLNLATIFATAGTDALFVGSSAQFRGVSLRMLESVTSVTNVASVSYWNDAWTPVTVTDKTQSTAAKSFSKGGALLWRMPDDWVLRPLDTFGRWYWVKVTTTATPTSALAGQLGVIRASVLAPVLTYWTLTLIMREAPTSQAGPWIEKAIWYEEQAKEAFQRALPSLGGEFESDEPPTDQISEEESEQTTAEVTSGPWRLERA